MHKSILISVFICDDYRLDVAAVFTSSILIRLVYCLRSC